MVLVARAQDGNLDAALHEVLHRVAHQAQALLVREAADGDDERARGVLGQAQLLLEGALALGLVLEIFGGVVRRDHRVGRRVPDALVDAVEDAAQDVAAAAEDAVEALAVEGHLKLVGVARAHRGEVVGVAEGALHVVDRVAVAVELVACRGDVGEAQDLLEDLVAVLALELDVVHGEDGLHVGALRDLLVELAQEHAAQGRLPVVAVQDVALELRDLGDGLADGLGEEREALAVVEVAVEAVALEVGLVVDEVEVEVLERELLDAAVLVAPRKRHVEVRDVLHLVLVLLRNAGVLGHDDGGAGAGMLEGAGKRPGDIAQAARLGKRDGLG